MHYSKNTINNTLSFNAKLSTLMHIDINSCFATIEQQANPLLRGKPVAVAAYDTPSGCILAPSVEAKKYGIKTGMRVKEGRVLYPELIILKPDPWKYRFVHLKLRKILERYTNKFSPKSIDEFVLDLEGYPVLKNNTMHEVARKIKKNIKNEIGEYITVSIGIAPSRFLAKTAAGLTKPDGLDEINKDNFWEIYNNLSLMDLCGINIKNTIRLNSAGIYSVVDFYNADIKTIRSAFPSIASYYWYLRLRGWEIDDIEFGRRSYGNSYSLPKPFETMEELSPILSKLVTKMSFRLRKAGYKTQGVHVSVLYRDGDYWHKGVKTEKVLFDTRDIYKRAYQVLSNCPYRKPVRNLAVSCFNLVYKKSAQLELFEDIEKKKELSRAVDEVNDRWGEYVITPARMISARENVPDRIAFGGVKELEEFTKSYH